MLSRIVITGVGLTSPNGDTLKEYRNNLLDGIAGVQLIDMRYMGKVPAGICSFDPKKYQSRKELRVGTRAGSIAIYAAHEAVQRGARARRADLVVEAVLIVARQKVGHPARRARLRRGTREDPARPRGGTRRTRGTGGGGGGIASGGGLLLLPLLLGLGLGLSWLTPE